MILLIKLQLSGHVSKIFLTVADTGGRVDMKRIYGITAVEERVRPGKVVKVCYYLYPILFSLYQHIYTNKYNLIYK